MDIIDDAQELTEFHRQQSIRDALNGRYRERERPLIIDGVRCCLGCEEPIPEERLRANPYAVRCTACQERKEPRR
ncbi:MAG: TraR/DksA C4-type zinc finger protein [Syntrophaceae bacterium]|nr:TraR/DksA C4-type zinc finger protein [Syntrophaceae bacterium]